MPNWTKVLGRAVLILTVLGVFLGIFVGGYPRIWKMGHAAEWSWWSYALAVPALGAAHLISQGIADTAISPLTWVGADQPQWKRTISYSLISVLGVALIVGPLWLVNLSR